MVAVRGEAELNVDPIRRAVEFRHVAPGEQQRVAVGAPEHAAGLRGIEIVEQRRDARRAGEKARHVPIRARVLFDHEGDVAIGIDERFRIAPGVKGEGERQRQPCAVIVGERNLLADRALKQAIDRRRS